MKRKFLVSLACLIFAFCFVTGCEMNGSGQIKQLNVEFEKYELPCQSGEVCNEIKNKIIQISDYEGEVNGENYSEIILTNEGNIYLYDVFSEKMVKVNGTTQLSKIKGTLQFNLKFVNAVIYDDNNYYSIDDFGNISDYSYENAVNLDTIISSNDDQIWGLDKKDVLKHYVSCDYYKRYISMNKHCSDELGWLEIKAVSDLNLKIKSFNSKTFTTYDNKMYSRSLFGYMPNDVDPEILDVEERNEKLILNDVYNSWAWSSGSSSWSGNLIAQTNDGNLHHIYGSFNSDYKFETVISFNEKVEDILYASGDYSFLINGENNVYLAINNYSNSNESYDLIKLDELRKYKKDIRSFYVRSGIFYVLLSDGNLYKIYEK